MESTRFHLSLAPRKLLTQGLGLELPILPFPYAQPPRCHIYCYTASLGVTFAAWPFPEPQKLGPGFWFPPNLGKENPCCFSFPFPAKVWPVLPPLARTQGSGLLQPPCTLLPGCLASLPALQILSTQTLSSPSAKTATWSHGGRGHTVGVYMGSMVMGATVITETTGQTLPEEAPGGPQSSTRLPPPSSWTGRWLQVASGH